MTKQKETTVQKQIKRAASRVRLEASLWCLGLTCLIGQAANFSWQLAAARAVLLTVVSQVLDC